MSYQIVLNTCSGQPEAERIARHLVEKQWAACVNIIPGVKSIYRWQGQVETNEELIILQHYLTQLV